MLSDIDKLSEQLIQMNTNATEKMAKQIGFENVERSIAQANFEELQKISLVTTNVDKVDPFIEELSELSESL